MEKIVLDLEEDIMVVAVLIQLIMLLVPVPVVRLLFPVITVVMQLMLLLLPVILFILDNRTIIPVCILKIR